MLIQQAKASLLAGFAKYFRVKAEGKFRGSTIDDFDVVNSIGSGASAEVKEAVHKSTRVPVALKIYEKSKLLDPLKRNSLIREIRILESLNHPNIMRIHTCLDTGTKVVMVLELVRGQSLKSLVGAKEGRCVSEQEAVPLFRQMVSAVAYCHSKGTSHRDLKLENILVTPQGQVKIIDFGFSVRMKPEERCKVFCGTPAYIAPEIITGSHYCPQPTDVWALGIILYAMLCGHFPFRGTKHDLRHWLGKGSRELYGKIVKGTFEFPTNKVSPRMREVVLSMLTGEPVRRPSLVDVLQRYFGKELLPAILARPAVCSDGEQQQKL